MNRICRLILIALAPALVATHVAADGGRDEDRVDLSGRVICAEGGAPIAGAAVSIHTARPREGASALCPSCHPDCGKRSVTSAVGEFRIEAVDRNLIFRALIMREGYHPALVSDLDPLGEPIEIMLKPIDPDVPAERIVRGRVVDEQGRPIAGAWVQSLGRYRPTRETPGMTFGGGMVHGRFEIDSQVVTDEKGEFSFTMGEGGLSVESYLAASRMNPDMAQRMFGDLTEMQLAVRAGAPGFARTIVVDLEGGGAMNEIALAKGVTIKGRVVDGRTPLEGVEVGFTQAGIGRSLERFLGEFTIGTAEDGTFEIANMPAGEQLFVYGKVRSLRGRGALAARSFQTGREGEVLDLGDLRVRPGFTIRGGVVLADGGEVPDGAQLFVSRDPAWDLLRIDIERDGTFVIADLPRESISISHRMGGYHMSLRNPGLDRLNIYQIVGRVEGDMEEFIILLEPGQPDQEKVAEMRDRARSATGSPEDPGQQPLRGYVPEE